MSITMTSTGTATQPSWDLTGGLHQLFAYHFMQNAFIAGTLIALAAGAVGYFMVLRRQSFAGHTLAQIGFAGAAGGVLLGWPPVVGLLLFAIGAALGIGKLGEKSTQTVWGFDIAIGTVHTFALGLGLLFVRLSSTNAAGVYAMLFGAVLGISDRDVWIIALTAVVTLLGLAVIARPLLFASIDPAVAEARGVPVRRLTIAFLVLLAFAVAQAVQVVGVLLIFALLVTPAAISQQVTSRLAPGIVLSIALALLFTWTGLTVAYFTAYPVGFFITTVAFGTYGLVRLSRLVRASLARRSRVMHERRLAGPLRPS